MSFRLLAVAFTAALVAVGISTGAMATSTAVPKLRGTIGPGYTISLKNAQGKKVKSLTHGKYTFIVSDKSNIHNFRIKGPGLNKQITTLSAKGSKTVTVTLKKGMYTYQCDPHASQGMKHTFRVR